MQRVPHDRTGRVPAESPAAPTPFRALGRYLVGTCAALFVTASVSRLAPKAAKFYRQPAPPHPIGEVVWGFDVAQPFSRFLFDFLVSRVTSPLVFGPLVVAVVLTLAFASNFRSGPGPR